MTTEEEDLDVAIRDLIRKMIDGTATERDRVSYQYKAARRAKLMYLTPIIPNLYEPRK